MKKIISSEYKKPKFTAKLSDRVKMPKYICSVFLDPGQITELPVENANSIQAGFVDALLFLLMLMLLKDVLTFPLKTISPRLVSAFNYQNAADLSALGLYIRIWKIVKEHSWKMELFITYNMWQLIRKLAMAVY